LSETTDGRRISKVGEWTTRSYSSTMFTRSMKTALIVSCQDQRDSGKYDNGRKSALRTNAGKASGARSDAAITIHTPSVRNG
jgi:hypothetical protein